MTRNSPGGTTRHGMRGEVCCVWRHLLPRDACISVAYAVVRCLSVTFVYCVETAKDTAIVAMETVPKLSNGTIFNDFE